MTVFVNPMQVRLCPAHDYYNQESLWLNLINDFDSLLLTRISAPTLVS